MHPSASAVTDQVVNDPHDLQYGLLEGPRVDALRESRVVAATRIRRDQRWPNYVSTTVSATGLSSQLTIRLFLEDKGHARRDEPLLHPQ